MGAKQLHKRNNRVKLDEPSMYIHGLGTKETERSGMNYIVDVINMEMFTIKAKLNSRDDRIRVSGSGSCGTQMSRGMYILSGSS